MAVHIIKSYTGPAHKFPESEARLDNEVIWSAHLSITGTECLYFLAGTEPRNSCLTKAHLWKSIQLGLLRLPERKLLPQSLVFFFH